ncbi:MAG TPA: nucleotidyltransferase family protein, partial [Caldisericia bacterium]|nr:nucleotidyltransferase family protein [Caldisericia bacterium]
DGEEFRIVKSGYVCGKVELKKLQISKNSTMYEAIKRINDTALKILIVAEETGKVIGTVTDGDIRRGILKGLSMDSLVGSFFNANPKTITEDNTEMAKEKMKTFGFDRLPLLDHQGFLKKIFSYELLTCPNGQKLCNNVVIMAGGKGVRLKPITDIIPKPLLPIQGKPIIHKIMHIFSKYGFNQFFLTLNYKKDMIKIYIESISEELLDVSLIEEEKFLGTAGSLSLLPQLNEPIFLTNCDILLDIDYRKALEYHKENNNEITVIGNLQEISVPYGILYQSNGSLIDIEEKPTLHYNVNTGIYILNPAVVERIPKNQQIDMPDVIKNEKKLGSKIGIYPTHEKWFDIGNWADLQRNC